ncbi:hypothetical protein Tco_0867308 [Tanacetum coccineum]
MLSLTERMERDLEARLMGKTLVINRSLDPLNEDYIELNNLNEPFELRRNQGDDLMPTIKEGEVTEEFRTRDDELNTEIVNMMSKKFHNSLMKEKMVYKGNNVVGALMNALIFVGTFSVVTDFVVLENMDAYRDEGMGDVIFGEPFLREVGIKTRRFEGMITIYNGNDEVTYQMVRSHPRFKHHTNEQCNKIPPLLKVSDEDKNNGISHPYQKLKGFYKGVLNLGPDYIRDAKTEEWLTRGHINVHEMEWTSMKVISTNIGREFTNPEDLLKNEDLFERVKRTNNKEYEFNYADLSRLGLNDMEGMYFLKVQGKPHHRKLEFEIDFINALLLYIRRVVIKNRIKDIR